MSDVAPRPLVPVFIKKESEQEKIKIHSFTLRQNNGWRQQNSKVWKLNNVGHSCKWFRHVLNFPRHSFAIGSLSLYFRDITVLTLIRWCFHLYFHKYWYLSVPFYINVLNYECKVTFYLHSWTLPLVGENVYCWWSRIFQTFFVDRVQTNSGIFILAKYQMT